MTCNVCTSGELFCTILYILYHIVFFSFQKKCLLQSNPIARWHICQGSINSISFSADGAYMATVGRDGTFFTYCHSHCMLCMLFLPISFSLQKS